MWQVSEGAEDEEEEEEEGIQWYIDQKVSNDGDGVQLINSGVKYGFAQTKCNVFSKLSVSESAFEYRGIWLGLLILKCVQNAGSKCFTKGTIVYGTKGEAIFLTNMNM